MGAVTDLQVAGRAKGRQESHKNLGVLTSLTLIRQQKAARSNHTRANVAQTVERSTVLQLWLRRTETASCCVASWQRLAQHRVESQTIAENRTTCTISQAIGPRRIRCHNMELCQGELKNEKFNKAAKLQNRSITASRRVAIVHSVRCCKNLLGRHRKAQNCQSNLEWRQVFPDKWICLKSCPVGSHYMKSVSIASD